MSAGKIVLIVGVPGAGKSTVAHELARLLPKAAWIEGDIIQNQLTVSGLVSPGSEPKEEAERQLNLRWRNVAALAVNFADAGFTAIVEHAASMRSWIDVFLEHVEGRSVSLIVLAPSIKVVLERDARRSKQVAERFLHMDSELRVELADTGWWIDTSTLSVSETVERILHTGMERGKITLSP